MKGLGFSADLGFFSASNANYYLHCHNEYEIFMFLEGDSKYVVEDKNYSLEPDDVIVIRKHEMHRIFHNSDKNYRRLSIMVSPDFFKLNNCQEYEHAFLEENLKTGNKIGAETVRKSGLYDAFSRLKDYSENYTKANVPVVNSTLIEILHLINKISVFENPDETSKTIKNIINYINNHFTSDITLDSLCELFFISKYHLCRIFKQSTGLTVQAYIRQKRLLLVSELQKEGKSLTEAALLAGFSSYSTFYRTYIQKNAHCPSKIDTKKGQI